MVTRLQRNVALAMLIPRHEAFFGRILKNATDTGNFKSSAGSPTPRIVLLSWVIGHSVKAWTLSVISKNLYPNGNRSNE